MPFENIRVRFAVSSLLGIFVDLLIYYFSLSTGISWVTAHLIAFLAGSTVTYLSWILWLSDRVSRDGDKSIIPSYMIVQFLALFLRGGVLAVMVKTLSWSPQAAIIPSIVASSSVTFFATRLWMLNREGNLNERDNPWPTLIIPIIAYTLLLRLLCTVALELIHEEAYYWNYAQHLDIGYLDHPPMVGWLIWVFTTLLGQSEFAIRAGAIICWLITAYYTYKLSFAVLGNQAAHRSLLLVTILPIYFSSGLIMTPEAPLIACWAGALYYLYRSLIEEYRSAWLGVGIFIGLGMLSKYTIALLGFAALAFILINQRSRKWLLRPEPYLALLLAVLLFSPVLIWNAEHQWASFLFQSTRRVTGGFDFDLPDLIGSVLFLLTPVGLLTAIATVTSRKAFLSEPADNGSRLNYRFLLTLTLLPLSVFVFFSLFRGTKLNWTGPLWLGIVPFMAIFTLPNFRGPAGKLPPYATRGWPATIIVVLILYGAALHYSALGFPAVPYPTNVPGIGSDDLARQVETITDTYEENTGEKPLIVYMDKDQMAGLIAFYRVKTAGDPSDTERWEIVSNTTGGHFFGKDSHMYRFWHPAEEHTDRVILLLGHKLSHMERDSVLSRAEPIGDIQTLVTIKNREVTGRYFYRFLRAGPGIQDLR